MAPTPQPWERLPDEPQAAYRAAAVYFKLGAARSLSAVAKSRKGTAKGPNGTIRKWSSTYRWVERADAYDRHVAGAEVRAHEDAIRNRAESEATEWAAFRKGWPEALREITTAVIDDLHRALATRPADPREARKVVRTMIRLMAEVTPHADRAIALGCPTSGPSTTTATLTAGEAAVGLRAMIEFREKGKP